MDDYEFLVNRIVNEIYHNILKQNVPPGINSTAMARKAIDRFLTTNETKLPESIKNPIDKMLQKELLKSDIMDVSRLQSANNPPIDIIKRDITSLKIDCIVNAANAKGLGCFIPDHKCIDNIIHAKAGPRLREACQKALKGERLKPGDAFLTMGYNLPSKFVIHTLGPIYNRLDEVDQCRQLAKCYTNSLEICKNKINSIAFCCISTGEFKFPKAIAAKIAIKSVREWLNKFKNYKIRVIFCTFSDEDYYLYQMLTKI